MRFYLLYLNAEESNPVTIINIGQVYINRIALLHENVPLLNSKVVREYNELINECKIPAAKCFASFY